MGKRTVGLDELPDYLKDADDNRFVVSLLEDKCFSEDKNDVYARMANVRLAAFIEQTKKFFPELHTGGDNGGNVAAFADRVGA